MCVHVCMHIKLGFQKEHSDSHFVRLLHFLCSSCLAAGSCTPPLGCRLGGYIADAYLGRYHTIVAFTLVYLAGVGGPDP